MVHSSAKENQTYNFEGSHNARAVKSTAVVIKRLTMMTLGIQLDNKNIIGFNSSVKKHTTLFDYDYLNNMRIMDSIMVNS